MSGRSKQTVLIVDDQEINRGILKYILENDYNTMEAENGLQALDILKGSRDRVNAILLDVIMPEMDGYGFLEAIRGTKYADLPIIVLTGSTDSEEENHALEMGAWDFISKPYQPQILLSRLRNAIARSQMHLFEQMRQMAEFDSLTGLFNRTKFYGETRKMLDDYPETEFAFIRVDIDQFSLLNTFWGEKGGDDFLRYMAAELKRQAEKIEHCTYGRINADIFCACVPYEEDIFRTVLNEVLERIRAFRDDYFIKPTFGIYAVTDRSMPVESMYECSSMAAKTCKGKYNTYFGYYDAGIRESSYREQEIVNEMQGALDGGQFVPYLQPKYDLKTNCPYGAEALARWIHPEKGMISPGEFIPVFEQNGFIGKLDHYMWDQVCRYLKQWIDEGLDPAPVSVNISRANMYNPNIVSDLVDLVKHYGIPSRLLNLELTESAYMDNPEVMRGVVHGLQANGFTVMMDDFGSGYSSLNTLKEISVDVLKIDMKFLQGDDGSGRSERILSSMIRMAGWLDLPVIVEGVETKQQVDFLKSVGCGYIQGYYFARPMPADDYRKLIAGIQAEDGPDDRSVDQSAMNETIWSSSPTMEFLFDHIRQPISVYEYSSDACSPLRVNKAFNQFFGYGENIVDFEKVSFFGDTSASRDKIHGLFLRVCELMATDMCTCDIKDKDGKLHTMQIVLNYLGEIEERKIVLAIFVERNDDIVSQQVAVLTDRANSMKHVYTSEEFEKLISVLKNEIPVLRLVDPVRRRVYDVQTQQVTDQVCHDFWGRRDRCDNCTSSHALRNKNIAIKIEVVEDRTYLVISKYVRIDGKEFVLEMLYDASEGMFMEARRESAVKEIVDGYNKMLITDPLTGIYNRRYLDENFVPSLNFCGDYINVSIAMLDIDDFKKVNDVHGHQAGDALLRDVGNYWRLHFDSRKKGSERFVVRYGGDEMLIVVCGMEYSEFRRLIERYYRDMRKTCYLIDEASIPFTISFGMASSEEFSSGFSWEELLKLADKRMYEKKSRKREA